MQYKSSRLRGSLYSGQMLIKVKTYRLRVFALLFALISPSLMASLQVDRQEGHSDKHVAKYVLDSSMASLIMDRELWGRCPSSLVGHEVELQAALFGSESCKLSELPQTISYLPPSHKHL